MPFGGLSPIGALLMAAPMLAFVLTLLAMAAGLVEGVPALIVFLGQLRPSAVMERFLVAICLVPLAATLRSRWVVPTYAVAAMAMPFLSFWGSHPYQVGIQPGIRMLGSHDWLAGIPVITFGAVLAFLARGGRHQSVSAPSSSIPYRAFAWSTLSLALIGVPAIFLWGGGTLDPAALWVLAQILAGFVKTTVLGGPAAGLAAYVLTRGLPGPFGTLGFLALGLLLSPFADPSWHSRPMDLGIIWISGYFLFAFALFLDERRGREWRWGTKPLTRETLTAT